MNVYCNDDFSVYNDIVLIFEKGKLHRFNNGKQALSFVNTLRNIPFQSVTLRDVQILCEKEGRTDLDRDDFIEIIELIDLNDTNVDSVEKCVKLYFSINELYDI